MNKKSQPNIAYFLLLAGVILWCFLIIAAPLLANHKFTYSAGFIYYFFSKTCHQLPDRSFTLWGKQFAVCARCTGIYWGFLLGTIIFPFVRGLNHDFTPHRHLFFIALVPLTIDLSLTLFQIWQNTFFTRFVTGLILGCIVPFFIIPGLIYLGKLKGGKKHGIKTG